jgi:dTDP-D-glucose 4,6-dehydratase
LNSFAFGVEAIDKLFSYVGNVEFSATFFAKSACSFLHVSINELRKLSDFVEEKSVQLFDDLFFVVSNFEI